MSAIDWPAHTAVRSVATDPAIALEQPPAECGENELPCVWAKLILSIRTSSPLMCCCCVHTTPSFLGKIQHADFAPWSAPCLYTDRRLRMIPSSMSLDHRLACCSWVATPISLALRLQERVLLVVAVPHCAQETARP